MILRESDGDTVIAIGQASHAWLSGQLARAWGNDAYPAPQPWEEVCLAAEQHDVGMAQWDLAPDPDPETGLPLRFYEIPRELHLRLWGQAAARLLTQSRHAALLVSLHGTGLYERFPPHDPSPELADAVATHLATQRALQERLVAELDLDWPAVLAHQQLLAVWDDLSLALCQDQARATGHELVIEVAGGDGRHTLDPWPFRAPVVHVACEGRRIAARHASAAALHRALEHGEHVALRFELRPA